VRDGRGSWKRFQERQWEASPAYSYRRPDPRGPHQEAQRCPSILDGAYLNYLHRAPAHTHQLADHTKESQMCLLIRGGVYHHCLLQGSPLRCGLIDPLVHSMIYHDHPLRIQTQRGHLTGHHPDTQMIPHVDHRLLHYLIPLYQVYIPQAPWISSYLPMWLPPSCHNQQIPPH